MICRWEVDKSMLLTIIHVAAEEAEETGIRIAE